MGFGAYDQGGSGAKMPTAIYDFVVVDADVMRRNGEPVTDPKTHKVRFRAVLEVTSGEFKGEKCPRTMNVTFAPSQEGKYGPFAEFIAVATGIPCGDPRQRDVDSNDLRGRLLRGMVKHERGYNNVTEFISAERSAALTAPPPGARVASPPIATTTTPAGDTNDQDLGHRGQRAAASVDFFERLSLPQRRQIDALAKAKHIDATGARMRLLVASIAGMNAPLDPEHVPQLVELLKKEIAA